MSDISSGIMPKKGLYWQNWIESEFEGFFDKKKSERTSNEMIFIERDNNIMRDNEKPVLDLINRVIIQENFGDIKTVLSEYVNSFKRWIKWI